MIDYLFEKWLEKNNQITNVIQMSNSELYNKCLVGKDLRSDILTQLKIAFEAGFNAKLEYKAEEYLQK